MYFASISVQIMSQSKIQHQAEVKTLCFMILHRAPMATLYRKLQCTVNFHCVPACLWLHCDKRDSCHMHVNCLGFRHSREWWDLKRSSSVFLINPLSCLPGKRNVVMDKSNIGREVWRDVADAESSFSLNESEKWVDALEKTTQHHSRKKWQTEQSLLTI